MPSMGCNPSCEIREAKTGAMDFEADAKSRLKLEDGTELPAYACRVKDSAPNGHSFRGRVEAGPVSGN